MELALDVVLLALTFGLILLLAVAAILWIKEEYVDMNPQVEPERADDAPAWDWNETWPTTW